MVHQTLVIESPFAAELREKLSRLGLEHPAIIRDDYDEANFGNAFVVFESGGVQLRFVRDRGLVTVDVGASDRFLSLDFVACRQRWTESAAVARHYARPADIPPTLPNDKPDGLYADLLAALEASDEAEAERIADRLEAGPETVTSLFSAAPTGPYLGVSAPGSESPAQADAIAVLADHWSEIAEALADERWLHSACDEERDFWKSIGRDPLFSDLVATRSLTAS